MRTQRMAPTPYPGRLLNLKLNLPPGIAFRLRADRGVETTSSGGTAVNASGDPVGLWRDTWTGSGYAFSQSTSGIRCSWSPNACGGRPAVYANGVDQYLAGNVASLDFARNAAGVTIYAVIKYGKTADQEDAIGIGRGSGQTNSRITLGTDATNFRLRSGGRITDGAGESFVEANSTESKSTGVFYIHGGVYDFSSGRVWARIDGRQYGPSAFVAPGATPDTASGSWSLFSAASLGAYTSASIAEIIGYRRVLSLDGLVRLERHFRQEYPGAFAWTA